METVWLGLGGAGVESPLASYVFLGVVTAIASAINSVAGGGTILTFPALVAILPAGPAQLVIANVTSKIGLWPGALAAAWEYRHERRDQPPWAVWLLLPSLLGSLLGTALIMVLPPELFEQLVPWLILLAAVLFAVQPRLSSWLGRHQPAAAGRAYRPSRRLLVLAAGLQFAVAVYGGYFGAGIGILMLAVLGSLELGDIHLLNGVKNVLGMVINAAATVLFAVGSLVGWTEVAWPEAGVMAVAAVAGGVAGGRLARRCSPRLIRRLVAVIGFALAGYHLLT
jgi:uncharacterized membrane protein YfcA